jgi:phosphoglycolate phosphatase
VSIASVDPRRVGAVLFDLDGTLIDSAHDLAGALNEMRGARGLDPVDYSLLRPHAGSGARGMLGAGLGARPEDPGYLNLRDEFLDLYEARMLSQTRVFAAVPSMLDGLGRRGVRWGIVTNKAARFAEPMARALGLLPGASTLVCGDSTPHTKPHPAPLLEAARRLGLPAPMCVYIGDDPRDVAAGKAAGMLAWAAAWGYLGPGAPVHDWGADRVLIDPGELLSFPELT